MLYSIHHQQQLIVMFNFRVVRQQWKSWEVKKIRLCCLMPLMNTTTVSFWNDVFIIYLLSFGWCWCYFRLVQHLWIDLIRANSSIADFRAGLFDQRDHFFLKLFLRNWQQKLLKRKLLSKMIIINYFGWNIQNNEMGAGALVAAENSHAFDPSMWVNHIDSSTFGALNPVGVSESNLVLWLIDLGIDEIRAMKLTDILWERGIVSPNELSLNWAINANMFEEHPA